MKAISSTVWGATARMLRTFYIAYVRAKIDYGSIIYSNAKKSLTQRLDIIQNKALRMLLGARNTSPILSMEVEAFLPPLEYHRGYLTVKQYIRLRTTPSSHTAAMLHINRLDINRMHTPLSFLESTKIWLRKLGMVPLVTPTEYDTPLAPWISLKKYVNIDDSMKICNNVEFSFYLDRYYSNYEKIFTDGSKIKGENPSVGAAAYFQSENRVVCWKLQNDHSVCAAELFAIRQTLNIIIPETNNYVIFTDSRSSLDMILGGGKKYSNLVNQIRSRLLFLNQSASVIIGWVRSHCGIKGNKLADRAANLSHKNNRTELFRLYDSEHISILKLKLSKYWRDQWLYLTNITGKGLYRRNLLQDFQYNKLIYSIKSRRSQVLMNRLRIGHIGVNEYLYRFRFRGIEGENCENPECDREGVVETVEHLILYCPKYRAERSVLLNQLATLGIPLTIKVILLCDHEYRDYFPFILKCFLAYLNSIPRTQSYF